LRLAEPLLPYDAEYLGLVILLYYLQS